MDIDSAGNIHLAYSKTQVESSSGDIIYRSWNGSNWSAETVLGPVENSYYHRPSITVGPDDKVHAVWIGTGGARNVLYYRNFDGNNWSSAKIVGQSTPEGSPGSFLNWANVSAVSANDLLVVWHDDNSTSAPSIIVYSVSHDGGQTWSSQQTLMQGHSPSTDARNGEAYVVCTQESGENSIVYYKWDGSSFSSPEVAVPPNNWMGWLDVAAGEYNDAHVVYATTLNDQNVIAYTYKIPSNIPPDPVTNFVAAEGNQQNELSWTNPTNGNFTGTMIRASNTGYPESPTDGNLVVEQSAAPGSTDEYIHSGLSNGETYYYTAFAHTSLPAYSSGLNALATPHVPGDFDHDNDIDIQDFGSFQLCLTGSFVSQEDPACIDALMDNDDDVDQDDVVLFKGCLSGANVVADLSCASR